MKVHFLNPGSIEQISGGYIFNKHFVLSLSANVQEFYLHEINDLQEMDSVVFEEEDLFILDSLLFFKDYNVSASFMKGKNVIPLIHLSDGLQNPNDVRKEGLLLAGLRVIVTSSFVKNQLQNDFGILGDDILVVEPGVAAIPKKEIYQEKIQHFVCVSNFVERKRILELLQILNELREYDWTLELIGDAKIEESYARLIIDFIEEQGLSDRVKVSTPLEQKELFEVMLGKDMLLHLAAYETFGMCIFEAAAMGLPILSTKTGAWEDLKTYPLAGFIAVDDLSAYKKALEHVLTSKFVKLENELIHQEMYGWNQMAEKFLTWLS